MDKCFCVMCEERSFLDLINELNWNSAINSSILPSTGEKLKRYWSSIFTKWWISALIFVNILRLVIRSCMSPDEVEKGQNVVVLFLNYHLESNKSCLWVFCLNQVFFFSVYYLVYCCDHFEDKTLYANTIVERVHNTRTWVKVMA